MSRLLQIPADLANADAGPQTNLGKASLTLSVIAHSCVSFADGLAALSLAVRRPLTGYRKHICALDIFVDWPTVRQRGLLQGDHRPLTWR